MLKLLSFAVASMSLLCAYLYVAANPPSVAPKPTAAVVVTPAPTPAPTKTPVRVVPQKVALKPTATPVPATPAPLTHIKETMTCTVYYCDGSSVTYEQVYPENCYNMQSTARASCTYDYPPNPFDVSDAVQQMQELSDIHYTLPTAAPIDGAIIIAPTPTPLSVPVGYP